MNAYQTALDQRIRGEIGGLLPARAKQFAAAWEKLQEKFLAAPASHKLSYHHCWQGGLAEHSLSVLNITRELAASVMGSLGTELQDSLTIAALFHDLGKSDGFYVPLAPDNWKRRDGTRYEYSKEWGPSHAQRSLFMLQQQGVQLNDLEYRAILLHDGQHKEANRDWSMKEPDLAIVLHWADVWDARHACTRPAGVED